MRKPYIASVPCLRKGLKKKQIPRRPRFVSRNARAPRNDNVEAAAREPMRCGFGAVRVGALLGRVRLHLHTDRFLAVHRGDTVWEKGCLQAALALGEIVAGMAAHELDALLPTSFGAASSSLTRRAPLTGDTGATAGGTLRRTTTPNLRGGGSGSGDAGTLGTRQQPAPGAAFAAAPDERGAR